VKEKKGGESYLHSYILESRKTIKRGGKGKKRERSCLPYINFYLQRIRGEQGEKERRRGGKELRLIPRVSKKKRLGERRAHLCRPRREGQRREKKGEGTLLLFFHHFLRRKEKSREGRKKGRKKGEFRSLLRHVSPVRKGEGKAEKGKKERKEMIISITFFPQDKGKKEEDRGEKEKGTRSHSPMKKGKGSREKKRTTLSPHP